MAARAKTAAEELDGFRREHTDYSQVRVAEILRSKGWDVSNRTVENWFRGYYRHPRSGEMRPSEPGVSQYAELVRILNDRAEALGRPARLAEVDVSPPKLQLLTTDRALSGGAMTKSSHSAIWVACQGQRIRTRAIFCPRIPLRALR